MEHYKSRNNDFFHFTNPHDDASQLDDDDSQFHDSFDDDRSCDFNFHTYYPVNFTQSPPFNFQTSGVMNSNDSVNKFGGFDICQLDHRMKGIFDKVQRTIEGIGVKISRVDGETCKIDKRVEDLKDTEERYHGMTHNKLRRMQSILQEVQDGVLFLRDKHEIAETQLQLTKLQVAKKDKMTSAQKNPQPQQPLPASHSSSLITFPPFLNQPPSNNVTLSPGISYHPAFPQASEINAQQHVIPPNLQSQAAQFPHFTQSYELNSSQGTPNSSSYNTSFYSLSQLMHIESSRNYESEFRAKYMPEFASISDIHTHGRPPSSYEISNVKPVEFSPHTEEESSINSSSHIPVIQALPHALPTAVVLEDESSSEVNGNAVTVDEIVDKVTAMGFRRDLVRACVRKLTVNGSPVDLNAVLDSMMKNK